jgi:hypothetical protein
VTPEERATILDLFPPKGEDPDEWVMAYRINKVIGLAATNSAIADSLPEAKFVLAAIREAVEAERERCAKIATSATIETYCPQCTAYGEDIAQAIRSSEKE